MNNLGDEGVKRKGVFITSSLPIALLSVSYRTSSSDVTSIFPTTSLAKDYYLTTYVADDRPEEFLMIGANDDTNVSITLPNGHTEQILLNTFDTYQFQGFDLSGTHVKATNNIALISGNRCVGVNASKCDFMAKQMPSSDNLQTHFIVSAMKPRPGFSIGIVASVNGTNVTIYDVNGLGLETFTMNSGTAEYRTFIQNETLSIVATEGIILTQHGHSRNADDYIYGDPSMVLVQSLDQFWKSYTFYALPLYNTNSVTITMRSAYNMSRLLLDGERLPETGAITVTVPDEDGTYDVIHIDTTEGVHDLTHLDDGVNFGAMVFGRQEATEYSYIPWTP